MTMVYIIGNRSSKSCKSIIENTGIKRYVGQKADIIVNYGLTEDKISLLFRRYPIAKDIPIINRYIGHSKYQSIKKAEQNGIIVPETRLVLPEKYVLSDWIEKRVHSSQGNGIISARGHGRITGKYYQKMIVDREYELRVHAFSWIPKNDWIIHKRTGPHDQIAWNFHQGGHFHSINYFEDQNILINAKSISEKILGIMEMSFGAVDLIVDNSNKIFFIEINSSPGFSGLSEEIYFKAMSRLKSLSIADIKRLIS